MGCAKKRVMKTRTPFILATMIIIVAGLVSCAKDPDVPTGKVFNAISGGGAGGGNGTYNGHAYVDLGLPSGLLWATCNVGANAPEDYGDYFAWGEITTKTTYNWSTYQYCNGSGSTFTKYCNHSYYGNNGFTDNLTVLQSSDDAATANWGNGWCMPTKAQWEELKDNTTITWTTQNGVSGRKFTVSNGYSLFLPAAGCRYDSSLSGAGSYGYYWSSSLGTEAPYYAWRLHFGSDGCYVDYGYRYYGQSVRPVRSNEYPGGGNSGGGSNSTDIYTISVSANPSNGGTVTGGGTYNESQSCTVRAVPNNNYTFTNWTENGTQVSTDASYSFTVTSNRTLVANFTFNGSDHNYVDLGLPSGTLWATCNIGANKPEDYGDYFAWGETTTKSTYNWSTYQYCNGSNNTLTKYCNSYSYGYNGFTDNLTTLLPEDDAAIVNWDNEWRMPTKEEFQELYNNTTVTWTTQNGVNGRRFTASNGNSLFLPAAGYRYYSSLSYAGSSGVYWSSSLTTEGPNNAWTLYFGSDTQDIYDVYGSNRDYGHSVRPVRSSGQN